MTPKDHKSHRLSYDTESDSPMNASTTSGAMNSALPTYETTRKFFKNVTTIAKKTHTNCECHPGTRSLTGVKS